MKGGYVGHCNVGTDIKQASFLGQRGVSQYVPGCKIACWDLNTTPLSTSFEQKQKGRLMKVLVGDEAGFR